MKMLKYIWYPLKGLAIATFFLAVLLPYSAYLFLYELGEEG